MASSVVFRAVALLLVAVSMALAQVTPSVSTDPLGGSTFTTPVYSPSQTFTPVTTYATAASRTPTTIGGATGPSPATGSYAFTYDAPISTVTNTPLDNVLSSVAANGEPTDYTRPFQPNPSNLQIVDAAPRVELGSASTFTIFALFGGMAFGAAWL